MRPIKFRIFSKGTSSNPNFNKFGQMFDINQLIVQKYYPGTSIFDKEDFVIQQFTGIKDIDGKEIYEGDFVELWTVANQKVPNMRGLYEIIWGRTGFDLRCHKTAAGDIWFQLQKDKSFENTDGSYFVPSKIVIDTLPLRGFNICKVVGNIFEDKNETN